ncbi:BREX-1 system phosphatase PglZ type A [uncultured Adlercreutzia sp.]|uniref:BREX-1 system phosphatase PglZ type A n=1 Tax=uncultured Adlercreutzia sp. TaxID=875803 RepID=UPI0025E275F8|nr:BREX-1 system phosphatase PglZ type A [uncultured Adlercreutzia sp.]MCI9261631.1 BREX-1 system phosphatase PglZ type A [Eggerthellaceae bacterium]
MQTEAKDQFLARFAAPLSGAARRRIVVWHDADGEFSEDFDALAAAAAAGQLTPGERPLQFARDEDGVLFALKRRIAREDTESDFALYRPRAAGDIAGDLLADIELYAEHFQADGLSLLVQDLGAADTREVREALAELRAFFAAKDRTAKFKAVMSQARTAADVRAGVLAAALGRVEPTPQAVVRAYAQAALVDAEAGESGRTLATLERYGVAAALARSVSGVTGYGGDLADADALAAHLLLSAFAASVPESLVRGLEDACSPQCGQFCLGIVHDWAAGDEAARTLLADAAEKVEREANLPMRFAGASLESLLETDVFPGVNRAIVANLAASLGQGADRRDDVRAAAAARRALAGYAEVACYFDALLAASAMQDFLRVHGEGYHEAPAAKVWEAYVGDWWQMDAAYRRFCEAYQRCVRDADPELSEAMQPVAEWADNHYVNGFLTPANECWIACAEGDWAREGYVADVPRQSRFYDEVVENELAGAKRVVVIVSDALRYEVARQLGDELERRLRVACECSAVQGVFPSVTPFGMAALLPHRSLAVNEETLAVSVDGMPTLSTAQREAVLKARRPASMALTAKDLLAMKSAEQREVAREAEVVYIYHNTIDATGEDASTEHDVFGACERAIDDICALVKVAVNQIKAARIVVTADHGFLYTRQPLGQAAKVSAAEIAGEAEKAKERFALVCGSVSDDRLLSVNMEPVGAGSLTGLAPRGIARLARPGGTSHYVHGGVSLQELCVPVLRVRYGGSRSKSIGAAEAAEVRLLDTNRRITSMLFGVRLYQPEPVGGKVAPAEYELMLVDDAGNPVSDTRRAVADRADADERARAMEVRFALREGRTYRSADEYYLVARNVETGEPLFRERYTVDIAFAPTDFGF